MGGYNADGMKELTESDSQNNYCLHVVVTGRKRTLA